MKIDWIFQFILMDTLYEFNEKVLKQKYEAILSMQYLSKRSSNTFTRMQDQHQRK